MSKGNELKDYVWGSKTGITRSGKRVTQIVCFEGVKDQIENQCIFGVIDGVVHSWYYDGKYSLVGFSDYDLFATPVEAWQWLCKHVSNSEYPYTITNGWYSTAEQANLWTAPDIVAFERVESSRKVLD